MTGKKVKIQEGELTKPMRLIEHLQRKVERLGISAAGVKYHLKKYMQEIEEKCEIVKDH